MRQRRCDTPNTKIIWAYHRVTEGTEKNQTLDLLLNLNKAFLGFCFTLCGSVVNKETL